MVKEHRKERLQVLAGATKLDVWCVAPDILDKACHVKEYIVVESHEGRPWDDPGARSIAIEERMVALQGGREPIDVDVETVSTIGRGVLRRREVITEVCRSSQREHLKSIPLRCTTCDHRVCGWLRRSGMLAINTQSRKRKVSSFSFRYHIVLQFFNQLCVYYFFFAVSRIECNYTIRRVAPRSFR